MIYLIQEEETPVEDTPEVPEEAPEEAPVEEVDTESEDEV